MIGTEYNVVFSDLAKLDLQNFTDHILEKYNDPFIVKRVMVDFSKTVEYMRVVGDSQPILTIPSVKGKKIRMVRFGKYSLKMFYQIHGNTIKVVRIKHGRQNYYEDLHF